ncbi:exostoses (multiple)-like 1 [Cricetulus griseus]
MREPAKARDAELLTVVCALLSISRRENSLPIFQTRKGKRGTVTTDAVGAHLISVISALSPLGEVPNVLLALAVGGHMPLWRRKSFWLALSVSWLLLILLGVFPLRLAVPPGPLPGCSQGWPRWLDAAFLQSFSQSETLPKDAPQLSQAPRGSSCTWGACFDTSKCKGNALKIFAHSPAGTTTEAHRRILDSLEGSRYYALSPTEACLHLFLPSQDHTCGPLPPYWNGGRNHLVLSLYPAPCTRLGQAMVAEASPSLDIFRPGFDVALPYLPEAHPLQGGAPGQLQQHSPQPGATLLAVAEEKGRWRIIDTHASTCPWGKHCEQDPGLHHPRWELPFSEVIDWTKAAIIADERLPLQVLTALRDMLPSKILSLRQQTQFLWTAYFSSVEKVIHTTLEIIQDRIWGTSAHPSLMWNSPPGALLALPTFSTSLKDFPFYHLQQGSSPESSFSALIWVGVSSEPLLKLIQVVAGSRYCAQASDRFFPYGDISTNVILSLDAHSTLSTSEAAEGPGPVPEPQPLAQDCFSRVAAGFGHMPLVSSRVRLEPVLFKDPVSVQRKKYRSLEKP